MLALEILIGVLHLIIGFVICFFLVKGWISLTKKQKELLQPDMNKYSKTKLIPKTGGIAVAISIVLTIFLYIFFKIFILNSTIHLIEILTLIITVILACFIGFIDDIFGWKNSSITGLKKILLTIPIAIPLMIINSGHNSMVLPFIGTVNFGIIYPLLIVPLSVVGVTNGFNIVAGFNGLEASLGVSILAALGIISLFTGQFWLALVAGVTIAALIAFLIFNWNPAKIFPGNTLTYGIGALIACFAILGNMEKATFIMFIPFIIEGILKARSKFKAWSFGIPQRDGSLEKPYKKIYGLTHLAIVVLKKIKKKAYETDVVVTILVFELIFIIFALLDFFIKII